MTKSGSEILVRTEEKKQAFNVVIKMYGEHGVDYDIFEDFAYHFPVNNITGIASGDLVIKEDNYLTEIKEASEVYLDKVIHGIRYVIINTKHMSKHSSRRRSSVFTYDSVYFNYFGHVVYNIFPSLDRHGDILIENEIQTIFDSTLGRDKYNSGLFIIPTAESDIRMVLPARDSIVQNNTYKRMLTDLTDVIRMFINTVGKHSLPYELYERIGGIYKEAEIPVEAVDVLDKEDVFVMNRGCTCLSRTFILDNYMLNNIQVIRGIQQYKGYKWYDRLTFVDEDDIYIYVDGDLIQSSGALDGVVDSIKATLSVGGVEKLSFDMDELVLDPDQYGDPRGDCDMEYCFIKTKEALAEATINYLLDFMLANWEEIADYDTDSTKIQRKEFEENILGQLIELFDPSKLTEHRIKTLMKSIRWRLSDFVGVVFEHRDGTKYITKKECPDEVKVLNE